MVIGVRWWVKRNFLDFQKGGNVLKTMITFIAATILAAIGSYFFGMAGMLLGSVAGSIVGWWAAKRLTP